MSCDTGRPSRQTVVAGARLFFGPGTCLLFASRAWSDASTLCLSVFVSKLADSRFRPFSDESYGSYSNVSCVISGSRARRRSAINGGSLVVP